eukprot:7992515-Alexandrium_andersonii.AAC.1
MIFRAARHTCVRLTISCLARTSTTSANLRFWDVRIPRNSGLGWPFRAVGVFGPQLPAVGCWASALVRSRVQTNM